MNTIDHFYFKTIERAILITGPMASGKTEFATKIYKDSLILKGKSPKILKKITNNNRIRTNVFFVRNELEKKRFKYCPEDSIPLRNGGVYKIQSYGFASTSQDIKELILQNSTYGTFIIDEACFYDSELVPILKEFSEKENILFILSTLLFSFRNEHFDENVKSLVKFTTKRYNLTGYCEDNECLSNGNLSYRFYKIDGKEIPAPYFDPIVIIGGDKSYDSEIYPNYQIRCSKHHSILARDYFYEFLKPEAEDYAKNNSNSFFTDELKLLKTNPKRSYFIESMRFPKDGHYLKYLAEKALITLHKEFNVLSLQQFNDLFEKYDLDITYLKKIS